jgi:hypothetical protein
MHWLVAREAWMPDQWNEPHLVTAAGLEDARQVNIIHVLRGRKLNALLSVEHLAE